MNLFYCQGERALYANTMSYQLRKLSKALRFLRAQILDEQMRVLRIHV